MKNHKLKIIFTIMLLALYSKAIADSSNTTLPYHSVDPQKVIGVVQRLFATAPEQLDLLEAKLTIDHLLAPSSDPQAIAQQIHTMAETVKSAFYAGISHKDKLNALSTFLYQSGYWNQGRAFQYDFNDPLGQNLANKQLHHYLQNRRGNCVSMPLLYLFVAEQAGIEGLTLSTAPLHILVTHKDATTNQPHIEATNHGFFADDAFYIQKSDISPQAQKTNLYLAPLNKKHILAVLVMLLSEHFEDQRHYRTSIAIAELALAHYPHYAYAMLKLGNAYSKLLQEGIKSVKAKGHYSLQEKAQLDHLWQQNQHWFKRAEQLGWQAQPTTSPSAKDTYLQEVARAAQQSKNG